MTPTSEVADSWSGSVPPVRGDEAVRLDDDGIDLLGADVPVDVRIDAAAADLWLFLMGRAQRDVLTVHGPTRVVDLLARAVTLVPRPGR